MEVILEPARREEIRLRESRVGGRDVYSQAAPPTAYIRAGTCRVGGLWRPPAKYRTREHPASLDRVGAIPSLPYTSL